jgi:acyl-coenzyme A synthetase/AMP-(fatty) acid ligase
MKRAVLSVTNPWDYIMELDDYSLMIINPDVGDLRKKYLLENSDYSLLITNNSELTRNGNDYPNERVFWYTSGTTGDSKFCSFSQAQIDTMAKTICEAYNITANDRYVSIMPLWHAHGQGFYWATKQAKCETNFLPVSRLKNMPQFDPTFVTAVPDLLGTIAQFGFQSLRFIRSASSPLPDALYQSLKEKFSVPVIEAFGMTEALSHCFTNPLHGEQRIGTVGLPSGIDARIEQGQLYIKGPCVFQPDWYNTGDLAEQDQHGYFKILGRSHDQINVRGIKLNPNSLEQHLMTTVEGLEQCVIFGTTRVKCVYVGACTDKDVKSALVELGSYCRPQVLVKLTEIPRADSGKISRSYLANIF